ncbi:MAG TPA: putative metal-dependent hydrolase [Symbiobacteriaceae bacterium]|nr:putative metal-dependent hydrolase [Symbiobacteriaceae bacterium]
MDEIRYPIGPVLLAERITPELIDTWMQMVASTPGDLRAAVQGLTAEQLDTPYREGGWTLRQVIHHLADGQLHFYLRFKKGLTEQEPQVQAYDENVWATLPDMNGPVEYSLAMLEGIHARWVALMQAMEFNLFTERAVTHSERGRMSLATVLNYGAWHGAHHTAQVAAHRKRMGW